MTSSFRADFYSGSVAILAGIVHLGAYWGWWWSPPENGTALYWRIGFTIVLLVVVAIAVGIASAMVNQGASEVDERETLISARSLRNVAFIYSGALAIILIEAFGDMTPMTLAHGVIAAFVVGEVVRLLSMIYYIRRGV